MTRKPHDYSKELAPEQREELAKIEAKAREVKRVKEIGDIQKMFEKAEKVRFTIKSDNGNGNGNGNGDARERQEPDEDEELAAVKLSKQDIDFMFETMMKESKYDGLSIRQTVHGLNSAFTKLPIPHVSTSKESGAGKSYIVNHIAGFYPDKYITRLAGVSDKALFHLDGPMIVIRDEEIGEFVMLDDILNEMDMIIEEREEEISKLKSQDKKTAPADTKDLIKEKKKQIKELETEKKDAEKSAQKLIDFDNKIVLVQDTPSPQFFNLIMTILSQDTTRDQEYAFTDKSSGGKLFTNKNRIRGMPVIMTTQVIDDTDNSRFEEKIRRFVHISPDTSVRKIREANRITALKYGYLPVEYDKLVVSRKDIARAKEIVKIVIAKLKQQKKFLGPKESGVRVPYALTILESMPVEEGEVWKMTVGERAMKYLSMITKLNMDSRPRVVDRQTGAFYPISVFDDLREMLMLMVRGASKVRPYLQQWFDDVFVPEINRLDGKPKEGENYLGLSYKEVIVGLTTEDLSKATGEAPDSIRRKYLDPLINLGLLQKAPSVRDNRLNIYYLSVPADTIKKVQQEKIPVTDPKLYPDRNLIVESLRTVIEYGDGDPSENKKFFDYEILDENEQPMTPEELADRYFSSPEEYFEKAFEEKK